LCAHHKTGHLLSDPLTQSELRLLKQTEHLTLPGGRELSTTTTSTTTTTTSTTFATPSTAAAAAAAAERGTFTMNPLSDVDAKPAPVTLLFLSSEFRLVLNNS
jgi:hypothetical protein